MRLMVRRLLVERFGLRVRTETRQMGTYALVLAARDGRLGDRMKPSTVDCQALIDAGKVVMPRPGGPRPLCAWRIGLMNGLSTMWVDGIRMARFATLLEPMAMRSITDKTGLTGTYDIDLQFLADRGLPIVPVAGTPAVSNEVPPLFTALQDQLGLKLESSRGAVTVVIVEQVQMPTPN
jgi:uncharacterized protein (TIGR03435 family)